MLRRVSDLAASGAPVEVGHAAFASMMDLQWRAMFSAGLDEATSGELHGFAREAVAHSLRPNVSDFFPALAALDLQGIRRKAGKVLAWLYTLIDEQIERRMRERTAGQLPKNDFMDVLLDYRGLEDGRGLDREMLRALLSVVSSFSLSNSRWTISHLKLTLSCLKLHCLKFAITVKC